MLIFQLMKFFFKSKCEIAPIFCLWPSLAVTTQTMEVIAVHFLKAVREKTLKFSHQCGCNVVYVT